MPTARAIKVCVSRDSRFCFPARHSKRKNSTGGEDVGLPLMTDSRFERDTGFLVFEEDFRFEPEESSGKANLEPVAGQKDEAPAHRSAAWPGRANSAARSPVLADGCASMRHPAHVPSVRAMPS